MKTAMAGIALCGLVALSFSTSAGAQDADLARQGESLYEAYCASCHGDGARGDGPRASTLEIPAADLTLLAQRYDGRFPMEEIIARLDGTEETMGHESPMPLWGRLFAAGPSVEVATRVGPQSINLTLLEIVEWLRTVQR